MADTDRPCCNHVEVIDHDRDNRQLGDGIMIVTGPPGSGKSTVSERLAAGFGRGVHLESDWFYRAIRGGFVAPHLPGAQEQNEVVMDVATDAAAGFAEAGYVVVWDGIVGPWFLDRIRRRLRSRDITLLYLVLRSDRETALDRVRRRDDTLETSGAEQMWDEFADLGDMQRHAISASGSVDEVVDRCREALRGRKFVLDGEVREVVSEGAPGVEVDSVRGVVDPS